MNHHFIIQILQFIEKSQIMLFLGTVLRLSMSAFRTNAKGEELFPLLLLWLQVWDDNYKTSTSQCVLNILIVVSRASPLGMLEEEMRVKPVVTVASLVNDIQPPGNVLRLFIDFPPWMIKLKLKFCSSHRGEKKYRFLLQTEYKIP